jgi:aspartyl-tRNA(Asn)/glutamyl-tRNA(Gln) amidotransferase subunit A
MSALHELSMTEAADAVARGEVTATALTKSCLARIAAHDGKVNSVIRLDRDSALEQAAAVDAARKAGKPLGPLGGVPMMHKDMYYRAGKKSGVISSPKSPRPCWKGWMPQARLIWAR